MLKNKRKSVTMSLLNSLVLVLMLGSSVFASNDSTLHRELSESDDIKITYEEGIPVIEVNNEEKEREIIKEIEENNKRIQKIKEKRLSEDRSYESDVSLNELNPNSRSLAYYSTNIRYGAPIRGKYKIDYFNANLRGSTTENGFGVRIFSTAKPTFYLVPDYSTVTTSNMTYSTSILDGRRTCAVSGSSFVKILGSTGVSSTYFYDFYIEFYSNETAAVF